MLEPGRYLVAEAGALITKVIYLKDRPEKRFVIVDAGMNDLIRPTLYEAYHPVVPLTPPADPTLITCDIVGPVCETGDYLALERPLPSVQPDDLLAILCAGAYGSVMSSQYNSRPFIAEALVNGNLWATIRERQSVEAIWAHESIPDWLK
jgi:diaminopimelate decarboxylase